MNLRRRPEGQVMWPEEPVRGESLLGWITRTAHANVLPSSSVLLRQAGLPSMMGPGAVLRETRTAANLGRILGAPDEEVLARMLHAAPTDGFVRLGDVQFRVRDLTSRARRFSPSSLAETGTHMSVAMVRRLPFCARSWEYLRDACALCGQVQRWRSAGDQRRCDACCGDLTVQDPDQVHAGLRAALLPVARLADAGLSSRDATPASLPGPLLGLDRSELLELVLVLARIVDPALATEPPARLDLPTQRRTAEAVARGWELLLGYPASIAEVAATHLAGRRRSQGRHGTDHFSKIIRDTLRAHQLPGVRRALATLRDRNGMVQQPGAGPVIPAKEGAAALGIGGDELAAARDLKLLRTRIGFRTYLVAELLDAEEIEHLARVRRGRLGTASVGQAVGLPQYGVRQLMDTQVLTSDDHPWLIHRFGGPQMVQSDLDRLLDRLRAGACREDSLEDPVMLRVAAAGYGGGPKPWGGHREQPARRIGTLPRHRPARHDQNHLRAAGRCSPLVLAAARSRG